MQNEKKKKYINQAIQMASLIVKESSLYAVKPPDSEKNACYAPKSHHDRPHQLTIYACDRHRRSKKTTLLSIHQLNAALLSTRSLNQRIKLSLT